MPSKLELQFESIRRLHEEFCIKGDTSALGHILARSEVKAIDTRLHSWYREKGPSPERLLHREQWAEVLQCSSFHALGYRIPDWPCYRNHISRDEWVGRPFLLEHTKGSTSEEQHLTALMKDFNERARRAFCTCMLQADTTVMCTTPFLISGWVERWLWFVYSLCPLRRRTPQSSILIDGEWISDGAFEVADFGCNVYLASAHALEVWMDHLNGGSAVKWVVENVPVGCAEDTNPFGKTAPAPTDGVRGMARRVIDTLRKVGRRLTTKELHAEVETIFGPTSQGMLKQCCAQLVEHKKITNRQDVRPRGYGLPEWPF